MHYGRRVARAIATKNRYYELRRVLRLAARDEDETAYRLLRRAINEPRYTRGRFAFPFGTLEYVDLVSLHSQYREIFIQHGYDFESRSETPFILDCGGNIGLSAIRFKYLYPRSSLTVFEADPRVTKVLRGNLLALGLEDVVVHDAAVWDQEGELCFASDGADSGRVCEASGEISVRAVRLSDWTTAPVDFLKLDIEGAEFVVLRDLYRSGGLRNVRRLGCEIHGRSGDPAELAEIFTMLSNFGFQYTVSHARSAPDLVGPQFGLPFGGPASGKYLLHLYAWQQGF